jgi:hypothetical protein
MKVNLLRFPQPNTVYRRIIENERLTQKTRMLALAAIQRPTRTNQLPRKAFDLLQEVEVMRECDQFGRCAYGWGTIDLARFVVGRFVLLLVLAKCAKPLLHDMPFRLRCRKFYLVPSRAKSAFKRDLNQELVERFRCWASIKPVPDRHHSLVVHDGVDCGRRRR